MKILGITDAITVCDCCGKSNLKKTVELETAAGEIVHYGCDCAAAAVLGKKSRKNADAVSRLAGAVSFVRRHLTDMKVDEMHNRLSACCWANVTLRRGIIVIWNDAGTVEVGA